MLSGSEDCAIVSLKNFKDVTSFYVKEGKWYDYGCENDEGIWKYRGAAICVVEYEI